MVISIVTCEPSALVSWIFTAVTAALSFFFSTSGLLQLTFGKSGQGR
jgi:hypothetical protein